MHLSVLPFLHTSHALTHKHPHLLDHFLVKMVKFMVTLRTLTPTVLILRFVHRNSVTYLPVFMIVLILKELIVGVCDRLSLGSGKEVLPYLKEGSERTLSYNLALAEDGNMGHIVPGHNYLLEPVCLLMCVL